MTVRILNYRGNTFFVLKINRGIELVSCQLTDNELNPKYIKLFGDYYPMINTMPNRKIRGYLIKLSKIEIQSVNKLIIALRRERQFYKHFDNLLQLLSIMIVKSDFKTTKYYNKKELSKKIARDTNLSFKWANNLILLKYRMCVHS